MVIVDEHIYHDLIKKKEPWKREPTDVSKSYLNDLLQSQLDNSDLPDDVKAKDYQAVLSRFLKVNNKQPNQKLSSLNGSIVRIQQKKQKKVVKKRKPIHWPAVPARLSRRKHIPWTRFNDA